MPPCALFVSLVLLQPLILLAQQAADPDLPQPLQSQKLESLATNSPFTRLVSLSEDLVLTGIAHLNGKPVATVFNKKTKESFLVGQEPNFQGWVLEEVLPAPDLTRSRILMSVGGERVRLAYQSLSKDDLKPDGKRSKESKLERSERGERFRPEGRGPSEDDRRRYESLSEKAREKFRDMMRSKFNDDKFRSAPDEERRNIIRKEFERIEKEDRGGK